MTLTQTLNQAELLKILASVADEEETTEEETTEDEDMEDEDMEDEDMEDDEQGMDTEEEAA